MQWRLTSPLSVACAVIAVGALTAPFARPMPCPGAGPLATFSTTPPPPPPLPARSAPARSAPAPSAPAPSVPALRLAGGSRASNAPRCPRRISSSARAARATSSSPARARPAISTRSMYEIARCGRPARWSACARSSQALHVRTARANRAARSAGARRSAGAGRSACAGDCARGDSAHARPGKPLRWLSIGPARGRRDHPQRVDMRPTCRLDIESLACASAVRSESMVAVHVS